MAHEGNKNLDQMSGLFQATTYFPVLDDSTVKKSRAQNSCRRTGRPWQFCSRKDTADCRLWHTRHMSRGRKGGESYDRLLLALCMWKSVDFFQQASPSEHVACCVLNTDTSTVFHCRTFSIDYLKIGGASICLYVKLPKNKWHSASSPHLSSNLL